MLDRSKICQSSASFNISKNRNVILGSAGGGIDTNGYDTTLSQSLSGSGTFTKDGAGTLIFEGKNTYTGDTNVNAGTMTLARSASIASALNIANAATFNNFGTVDGPVSNNGNLNILGDLSRITRPISGNGIININGRFVQEASITNGTINLNDKAILYATDSITATTGLNVNAGGSLYARSNITSPSVAVADGGSILVDGRRTITGNVTNSGLVKPILVSDKLTVTGTYTQTVSGKFSTSISSTSSYGTLQSNQPLNIASGSTILAQMDPRLRIGPGTVFQAVLKGTGTPVQSQINVFTDTPRYKLTAVWAGDQVNLEYLSTYYGALTKQTLYSLSPLQGSTLNALHQRYAVLNAVMEYDCNKFDKHNFCISAEARGTGFGSQATGAGVFNIAYRPTEKTRVGAYLDYQVAAGNPATNPQAVAGTVSSGSVNYGYGNVKTCPSVVLDDGGWRLLLPSLVWQQGHRAKARSYCCSGQ